MKIKICGLSNPKEVQKSVEFGSNFCGFILNYPKSHRHVSYENVSNLIKIDRRNSSFVGVLVKPSETELLKFSKLELDYFQIYGDLSLEQITFVKSKYNKKIIMALQIKEEQDVLKYKTYENIADIVLFDSSGLHQSLSWNYNWIKIVPSSIKKMLAGNINIDMLENLKEITDIVDLSGALETNKVKDIIKIKMFLEKIKKVNG